jgi:uncharacterized protein with von Willebrand factor type A (vWA) domain
MPNKNSPSFYLAERGLTENITRFSHLLIDHGVAVSLPSVLDALRGLPLIDIFSPEQFKCLLQVNLICRQDDLALFEKMFHEFWIKRDRDGRQLAVEQSEKSRVDQNLKAIPARHENHFRPPGEDEPPGHQQWAVRYSPDSFHRRAATIAVPFAESRALYETIRQLLQPLNRRRSRRYRYTLRGRQISLRRILRRNMQFGGELIFLDFKKKRFKKRRIVFFCDVSGSMDIHTLMILQFVHALKRIDRRTEIFCFSTDLTRATSKFMVNDFTAAISGLPAMIADWGGGTRIGHCLRIFNENYGRFRLSRKDIVIIFSDGWDRGEIKEIELQMATLKRQAYKIIWLNPLLATKDYQPICQGMRTALPYVDYFLPMGALEDLRLLRRTIAEMGITQP